jgi:hypothetical protein
VPAIVHVEELLAVARGPAVVDREDRIAVVDQVLELRGVAAPRLAARTAVVPSSYSVRRSQGW